MKARRRRGLLLLSLALASGGLAASEVGRKVSEVEARVGPTVPVLVARQDLAAGRELEAGAARRLLAVREVPAAFAPPDALGEPAEAEGLAPAAPVPKGGYVTAAHFQAAGRRRANGGPLRPGERAIELAVTGGQALAATGPGSRVDVLVSSEPRDGAGRSFLALEDVELLDLGAAPGEAAAGGEDAGSVPTATATLRVTLRQAVYLTAAQNFAREVRLLSRPAGDRRRGGRFGVGASGL